MLLYNDQSGLLGANVGVGVRKYYGQLNRILGANVYYDLRQIQDSPTRTSEFHQVGIGFESLGEIFDFRVFGNAPTKQDRQSFQIDPIATPYFGGANGQNIVYGVERLRQALGTLDLEGGALLLSRYDYAISAFGGAYHLWGDSVSEWGTRGRLEFRFNDKLFVNGFLQHDPIFNTTGGVVAELRFGSPNSRPNSNYYMPSRLADPVQRRRYISIYETEQDLVHTIAGRAITVRHVNSNAASDGDGSIDNPNNHLASASNRSEDIILLHGGSLFDNQQIVISSDGQRLLGEGVPHYFSSDYGAFLLPGSNPSGTTPLIQNSTSSPAVMISANNVEVSGLAVSNSQSGIYGDGIRGFNVNRNSLQQNNIGIELMNIAGTGTIRENIATNNDTHGIFVNGDLTGQIIDNISSNNLGGSGIDFDGNFSGTVSGNTTNDNFNWGMIIRGRVDGDIVYNTALSNSFEGIRVFNRVVGNIANNTASDNGSSGLSFQSFVIGNIENNVALRNRNGLVTRGGVTGDIINNLLIDNSFSGLNVQGDVTGDIVNNTILGNSLYGLLVTNSINGNVTGNNLSSNGGGLQVGIDVIGDVTDNQASNNTMFGGIRIQGTHEGALSRNTANNNHFWGISVGGDKIGDVENNIANNNSHLGASFNFYGIGFENAVIGNLISNQTDGNHQKGIYLSNGIFGNVANNSANNNGEEGIRILQNIDGSFVGNTTNFNLATGTWISGDVGLDFINNTANNNGGNGLQVDGTIGGASSPNAASGNAGIDHAY